MINDGAAYEVAADFGRDGDLAAFGAVFDGVVDEICQYFSEAVAVGGDSWQIIRDGDSQQTVLRASAKL